MRADRPSSTATLIAAATVFLARQPEFAELVPPGAAEICARCLTRLQLTVITAIAQRGLSSLGWAAERATIPGLMTHFMLRKRWIEEAVRGALGRGCRQVAVVGAGFDTLAARLAPQFPAVRFIEIDHPATQAPKRRALQNSSIDFVAADLARTSLQSALAGRAQAPVVVIEGLLMYLTEAEIAALFSALAELQASEAIFTVMEPAPGRGRVAFHNATWLERVLLALWKEPFKTALGREALPAFLAPFGLRLLRAAGADELGSPARGEMIVHATRQP